MTRVSLVIRFCAFVAAATVVVACDDRDRHRDTTTIDSAPALGDADRAAAPVDARPLAVPPRRSYLRCSPTELRPTDTLVMRMDVPHGGTFMIASPDNTPYLVTFVPGADMVRRVSLMSPDSFSNLAELKIDPGTFSAGPHVFGRDTNELVFRRPGGYRLLVGSELMTDGPDYAECLVRFRP